MAEMTAEEKRARFLEPETRCGHYVSAETKACWQVMLDLAENFVRVCEKHGLRYMLAGGSLLGAVRHGGFIPWDDDLDLAMPREDYDRFVGLAGEFSHPHFLQTALTDREYTITHAKLRNSETTALLPNHIEKDLRFNEGIFIDVFPLDPYPDSPGLRRRTERREWILRGLRTYAMRRRFGRPVLDRMLKLVGRLALCVVGADGLWNRQERMYRGLPPGREGLFVMGASEFGFETRYRWPGRTMATFVDLPFEYLTFKCPADYDAILTGIYGDWHKFVKGDSLHGGLVVDASRPYPEVIRERFGIDVSPAR